MLSFHILKENPEWVKERLRFRGFTTPQLVDDILSTARTKNEAKQKEEIIAHQLNEQAREMAILMKHADKGKDIAQKKETVACLKQEMNALKKKERGLTKQLHEMLVQLPNIPHESVPQGTSEKANILVRENHNPIVTSEKIETKKPHWEIAKELDIINLELGTKITGSGFPFYKGMGAVLQRSLIQYCLDFNRSIGYVEYQSPFLINEESAFGTGQLPDKEGQMYEVPKDGLFLIPTAEVPLTNIYRNELLKESELPVKMTGHSTCFRREAGSYGKNVRGLNRIHQFEKVEIVQITKPEKSYEILEEMVNQVEELIQSLELPYRIIKLCAGDTGFTSALTYDFEVYSPGQESWLEVSSVSNFETFQSNRLNLKYKDGVSHKNKLLHTLNGSALAMPRIIASILETYQESGGGVATPRVLLPYLKSEKIG